nr:hypothetical protein [Tanacetum cinerariifolium]
NQFPPLNGSSRVSENQRLRQPHVMNVSCGWILRVFRCMLGLVKHFLGSVKSGGDLNIEDTTDHSFGRKRLCLATKNPVSIIETFKIIVKGKVFMVHVKELFTWNPTFVPSKAIVYSSDDDSVQADNENDVHPGDNDVEGGNDNASTDDGVAEMVFDTGVIGEQHSVDPFELYGL